MRMAFAMFSDQSDISKKNCPGDYIFRNMQQAGADIFPAGKNVENHLLYFKSRTALARAFGKQFLRQRNPLYLKTVAKRIEKDIADAAGAGDYDCVFAFGALQLSYLNVSKPMYFWSDTPFRGLIELNNPQYRNMYKSNLRDAERADKLALDKCRLAFYSSDWASDLAAEAYHIDRRKIITVPLGANIIREPDEQDVEKYIAARCRQKRKEVNLILAGQNWEFKGVPIACEVVKRLNSMSAATAAEGGVKYRLTVIGNSTKVPDEYAAFVENAGSFNKNTEEGWKRFDALFRNAFCYIMPTRCEAFGHVYCEANAYGLPALGTALGGVTEIIRNGINGQTFAFDAPIDEYCRFIKQLYEDENAYVAMSRRAFREYTERLRWSTNCQRIFNIIKNDLNL